MVSIHKSLSLVLTQSTSFIFQWVGFQINHRDREALLQPGNPRNGAVIFMYLYLHLLLHYS